MFGSFSARRLSLSPCSMFFSSGTIRELSGIASLDGSSGCRLGWGHLITREAETDSFIYYLMPCEIREDDILRFSLS